MSESKEYCHKSKKRSEKEHKDLLNRLSRVEGQIRGIRRMVEEDAYCTDIRFSALSFPFTDAPYPASSTAAMISSALTFPSTPIEFVKRLSAGWSRRTLTVRISLCRYLRRTQLLTVLAKSCSLSISVPVWPTISGRGRTIRLKSWSLHCRN